MGYGRAEMQRRWRVLKQLEAAQSRFSFQVGLLPLIDLSDIKKNGLASWGLAAHHQQTPCGSSDSASFALAPKH